MPELFGPQHFGAEIAPAHVNRIAGRDLSQQNPAHDRHIQRLVAVQVGRDEVLHVGFALQHLPQELRDEVRQALSFRNGTARADDFRAVELRRAGHDVVSLTAGRKGKQFTDEVEADFLYIRPVFGRRLHIAVVVQHHENAFRLRDVTAGHVFGNAFRRKSVFESLLTVPVGGLTGRFDAGRRICVGALFGLFKMLGRHFLLSFCE